ncbi:MAG: hypothetical protein LUG98_11560, partial [Tannerellaceae bacterium]|nr:hypothetical protein [Tannerellaceae bacterium]
MSISDRLKQFLEFKGLEPKTAAEKLEMTDGGFNNYTNKGRKPNTDTLLKFGDVFPDLNLHWLLTGYGNMICEVTLDASIDYNKLHAKDTSTYVPILTKKIQGSAAIRERLQDVISTYHIDMELLSQKTNIPTPTLQMQIYGKKPISIEVIREITQLISEISYVWILTGNLEEQNYASLTNRLINDLKEFTKQLTETTERLIDSEKQNAGLREQ